MKFLIISRPNRQSAGEPATSASLLSARESIHAYLERRVLDRAYAIIGGGSVYVVNVDSPEQLENGLRDHRLTRLSDLEVHLIREV